MWTYIIAGIIILGSIATILGEVKSYLNGVKESGRAEIRLEDAKKLAAAKEAADKQKALQDATTKEIRANGKKDRDKLTLYYERRLLDNGAETNRGSVPSASLSSGGANAGSSEQVASGPGFERSCALDAQQVGLFQEWVRKQKLPID